MAGVETGSDGLTHWQLVELTVFLIELESVSEMSTQVEYDVQLPDRVTGRPRQVDAAVRSFASGREFLRIVEVQDRSTKVGSPFIDQVETKANRVGAHRVTVVSTAGFTTPAIERIQSNETLIDAYVLRDVAAEEWPINWPDPSVDLDVDGRILTVRLEARALARATDDEAEFLILFGAPEWSEWSGVLAYLLPPKSRLVPGADVQIAPRMLAPGLPGAEETLRFTQTIRFEGASGRGSVSSSGRAVHEVDLGRLSRNRNAK